MFIAWLSYAILVLGFINVLRLAIFMISADWYDIRKMREERLSPRVKQYRPYVTIIVPAYNEEMGVIRTVESVLANDYPYKQLIVVDDGSSDKTLSRLRAFKRKTKSKQLKIVHQSNQGKAAAINNALKRHARGSLVMVLDADSLLSSNAISNMVKHFEDSEVAAAAANVKVIDSNGILNAAQRLEYVVSYRMKRALTVLNVEYIIGGVGSTFRKDIIVACEYYDTDTMTEDIDFTMKIINRKGNRKNKITFASDVLTYTESVESFGGLLKQRFRWKYGRMQAFYKNRDVFFSTDKKHTKRLAWLYLPFILFSEAILLFDPFLTVFVLYASLRFAGLSGLLSVYAFVTVFSLINILSERTETRRNKLTLVGLVPVAYPLLMIMSLVDFMVLIKALYKFPDIVRNKNQVSHWQHVERTGAAANISL